MQGVPLSDCEPIRDGVILQPVNAATALAYVAAGAWLLWRWRRHPTPWLLRGYATAAALVGVGSAAFHAIGGAAAQVVHDASLVLMAGLAVATGVRVWRRRVRGPGAPSWTGLTAVLVAVPFQVFGRTGGPLCAAGTIPSHGIWHVLTAVALAAGGMAAHRMLR